MICRSIDYPMFDYNPGGMLMQGRNFVVDDYRFGFNGVEKVDEVTTLSGHYEFKFREYEARLGRFWSIDPLAKDYPWNSPYAFAENRVIDGVDLEGLEYENTSDKGGTYGPLTDKAAAASGAVLGSEFKSENQVKQDAENQNRKIIFDQAAKMNQQQSPNAEIRSNDLANSRPDIARDLQIGQGVAYGLGGEYLGLGFAKGVQGFKNLGRTLTTFEGIPIIKFTTGKEVIKYVPEGSNYYPFNKNGVSFTTNLRTTSTQEAYQSLGLGYKTSTGVINQISNSYSIYQASLRGFYLSGKVASQGATSGGATQFVGFRGFTTVRDAVQVGKTIPIK